MSNIVIAQSDTDICRCHPVMAELRPHYDERTFLAQVRRQQAQHAYQLAFLEASGVIKAVAGYRVSECLAWGRFFYVDDLVSAARFRSQGCGRALFTWLVDEARAQDCDQFHLDSGVHRFGAHRFYLGQRMDITSHHFCLKLK